MKHPVPVMKWTFITTSGNGDEEGILLTNCMVDDLPVQGTPLSGSLKASTIMACKSTIVECGLRQPRPCYILCPEKQQLKYPAVYLLDSFQ